MCSTLSSTCPFSLPSFLPPRLLPLWWSRKVFPQGLPSPSPITLWSPPLPSLPPSLPCPLTAPPGYAAWASMTVTLMVKILTSERYLGVSAPVLPSLHPVLTVVQCHHLKTLLLTLSINRYHSFLHNPSVLPSSKPPFIQALHPLPLMIPLYLHISLYLSFQSTFP